MDHVQHLVCRSGLSQDMCRRLVEASRWSAHVRATLDAFTHAAFGVHESPNHRLEIFASGLLALADSHRQAIEHVTQLLDRQLPPLVLTLTKEEKKDV